jgi:RNA polymerase sigma-70 factor (ECF subfamily)
MNTRNESDEWLMAQVVRGRQDCLEVLVRRYASPLLTFIQRMVGDRHHSEELFQEVFLTIWTKRKRYKPRHRFRSWLFTIAANRCRTDFRRRTVATAPVDPAGEPSGDSSPAQTAIATETASLVGEAVATLPQQQRMTVVLRAWNGLSYAEIADVVGTSESAVRSNMHRGLASLRRYLEPRLK